MNVEKAINRILTCSVALSMSFLLPLQSQAYAQEETYLSNNTVYNSSYLTVTKLNNEQKDTLHKIVSGSIAVLGIGFFIDLTAKIVGTVAQQKGICFTLQWGFPPLVSIIM